jgi:hypothetical protein
MSFSLLMLLIFGVLAVLTFGLCLLGEDEARREDMEARERLMQARLEQVERRKSDERGDE